MKKLLLVMIFFIATVQAASSLKEKYPYGLLTDDYGILTEADMLYDLKNANPSPYDIKKMQTGYYRWQCFPIKKVTFTYTLWRDSHPKGSSSEIVWLCSYRYLVSENGIRHRYYDRGVQTREGCRKMFKEIQRLRKGEEYICLNGEPSIFEGMEKGWTWNKTKTKKGCMSMFYGDCDTE